MEGLYAYHDTLIQNTQLKNYRYLYPCVDWNQRLSAIEGARGTGKTTMMLQYIKNQYSQGDKQVLYTTLEHPHFLKETLFETVNQFYQQGGRHLFIDEVHKYPNWAREIKVLYDGYPDLKMMLSASSSLDLLRGNADLSRRISIYKLAGLSLREYLNFNHNLSLQVIPIDEIFKSQRTLASNLSSSINILPEFKTYLQSGYYPFHLEMDQRQYHVRLLQVINTIIDVDMRDVENFNNETSKKIKLLLNLIADSVPFKPNISNLARDTNTSRDIVYKYIENLEKAQLLNSAYYTESAKTRMRKPDKLYLENTNLNYALSTHADIGNIRETFVLNQLNNADHKTSLHQSADFLIEGIDVVVEVGGKNKKKNQIQDIANGYLVKDNTITASDTTIPIWLFGFLY